MFFHTWMDLLRTLIVGILAYSWLVFFQRISGKRTLSKMNAFDLIVTVALGSSLATILLSKDVSLAEGAFVIALLMGLQYVVTWLSVHAKGVDRVVKAEPTLLFYQGRFLEDAMREQRVVKSEILQAARSTGILSMERMEASQLSGNRMRVEEIAHFVTSATCPDRISRGSDMQHRLSHIQVS